MEFTTQSLDRLSESLAEAMLKSGLKCPTLDEEALKVQRERFRHALLLARAMQLGVRGAHWLNADELLKELRARELKGL